MTTQQADFFAPDRLPKEGVFIDLGYYPGDVIELVLDHTNCFIHAFDLPDNPNLQIPSRVQYHDCYAWDSYDMLNITGSEEQRSACPGRGRADFGAKVKAIRFAEWMINISSVRRQGGEPRITVKMDIEGAEYRVIPDMIRLGVFDWVDTWFIDWHHHKFKPGFRPDNVEFLSDQFGHLNYVGRAKSYHWMHGYGEVNPRDLNKLWKAKPVV